VTPRRARTRLAVVLAAVATLAGSRAAAAPPEAPPAWDPATTWAVLIGVLEWENPGFAPFPKEARVDRALEKTLLARGVRPDRTTFLEDEAATTAECREALAKVARSAKEGDTVLFYYAGHGWRNRAGEVFLAPYDVDGDDESTALSVAEIGTVLSKEFHGSRILLFADCCHSGALGRVAEGYAKGTSPRAGAITSSTEDVLSTGNWTFTESLVAVLSGAGAPDADGSGTTTFAEADAHVRREMRFRERQPTAARVGAMEPEFVLARVDPARVVKKLEGGRRVGEFVEFEADEGWETGEVIGAEKGRVLVRRTNAKQPGEWVDAAKVRAPLPLTVRPGEAVEVEWKGRWWPAGVRRTLHDFARVHYDGFGTEWDEWVLPARVRARK
jgi:hypothetical protein